MKKRILWCCGFLALVLVAFTTMAILAARQPPYSFLAGLEPVYEGRPLSVGGVTTEGHVYMTIYSVRGDYEQWKNKVVPEMKQFGVTPKEDMNGMPTRQMSWLLESRPHGSGTMTLKSVSLVENAVMSPGSSSPFAFSGPHKGSVLIIVMDRQKPTLVTKVSDWWRKLTRGT